MSDPKKRIVSKFGGSSMADAAAMRRSAAIAMRQKSTVVVVSATYGTTNQLVEGVEAAASENSDAVARVVASIADNHTSIARDLNADVHTTSKLSQLLDELKDLFQKRIEAARADSDIREVRQLEDAVYGMGERMSSELFTACLKSIGAHAVCFDASDVIRTDDRFSRARPDFDVIEDLAVGRLEPLMNTSNQQIVVTQGFIGSTVSGLRTTLGRGGSDYSAAILAWALNADILEIWTDVGGVATTDPRITARARPIAELSFQEAAEMATFGAKILHPSTLIPAIWKEIPVYVGSSIDSESGGTWIYRQVGQAPLVRAVTIRRKQTLLTITTPDMLNTYGFLFRVFQVFNENQVSVDSITTSEISVAMTVDAPTLQDQNLIRDLEALGQVGVQQGYALVSVIGNNINHTPGLSQQIFGELTDINVRMISQGASKHNFCILVDEDRGEEAVRRLHARLIETQPAQKE